VLLKPRLALSVAVALLTLAARPGAWAEEPPADPSRLHEPVYRVSAKQDSAPMALEDTHPLDPALDMAREGLEHIQANIRDYTCVVVKRERVNGQVGDEEYMYAKVRNAKIRDGQVQVPFSVYLRFVKPKRIAGREVIYVAGENNDKLIAHEGGFRGKVTPSVWLHPTSFLAMQGQRYPITEIGIETLCQRLIERGSRDRAGGPCEVDIKRAKINKRPCTLIEVKHEKRLPHLDFFRAEIFVDEELNVPVRYAAYDWPLTPGGIPELIEEYTYVNMKLNVGLTDQDFDPENPQYNLN
jgi:hypothetical protein